MTAFGSGAFKWHALRSGAAGAAGSGGVEITVFARREAGLCWVITVERRPSTAAGGQRKGASREKQRFDPEVPHSCDAREPRIRPEIQPFILALARLIADDLKRHPPEPAQPE